jgi:outer membrane protein OmpA-like peptidoglycan-associated protein
LLAGGCATRSVTLLPGENGHPVGALAVLNEDGSERGILDTANARASLTGGHGAVHPSTVAASDVDKQYGALIADLPPPPEKFVLTFDIGEAQPPPDQEATLQAIFKAAASRPGAEVQVVGHTDRVDTEEVNDRLSRRRAEDVRAYLISRGLPPDQVRATWRGEREPLVETANGVPNQRNRRVEVIVR